MSDLPDFLSDEPSAASEPTAAAPSPEPAPQPEPQPTPEPAAAASPDPAPQPADPPHVPVLALLDEREKRQAAERARDEAEKRARDLEQWRQQQEAAARRQPIPSRDEDPDAYEQHQRAVIDEQQFVMRRDFSREIATIKHGEQVVGTAFEWGVQRCDADPHFNAKVRSHPNPIEFVVSEWKRDQVASKVDPSKYEAFLAWEAQQAANPAPQAQPAAPAAPAQPAAPRPSLAAAPSAGSSSGAVPRDGAATFDAMFG